MTDLNNLIERLEAATEGSEALNRLVALAIGWKEVPAPRSQWATAFIRPNGYKSPLLPDWTTSIDAALSLVGEGVEYEITNLYGVARVAVGLNFQSSPEYASRKDGNVILALVTASLKAHQAQKEQAA